MRSRMIDFSEQVAIVTGAGRGLGRLYALDLARRGASVVVNDLGVTMGGEGDDTHVADAVLREIRAAGGAAVASYESVATVQGGQAAAEPAPTPVAVTNRQCPRAGRTRQTMVPEAERALDLELHLSRRDVIVNHYRSTVAR